MLNDSSLEKKYAAKERSASAVVFYWAVEKIIPELKLHNIFFAGDYKAEFERMFNERKFSSDPTVYIHISSTINPDDAPANGQNWFVMINTPAGAVVTEDQLETYRKCIYKIIQKKFQIDISSYIKHEEHWD